MKRKAIKIKTTGSWTGKLRLIENGRVIKEVEEQGFLSYTHTKRIKKKTTLRVDLTGVKSEDFGIVIEVADPGKVSYLD